jgi:hypothetical protein
MRVTFVAQGWEQLAISQLGEILLAEGHEVSLAFSASLFDDRYHLCMPKLARFFDDRADVLAQIERTRPELLALSPLTSNYQWMLSVARRQLGLPADDLRGVLDVLALHREDLVDHPEQGFERRGDRLAPADRAVAMEDLLEHLGVGHQPPAGADRRLEQPPGLALERVLGTHQVHRDVRVDQDHPSRPR